MKLVRLVERRAPMIGRTEYAYIIIYYKGIYTRTHILI